MVLETWNEHEGKASSPGTVGARAREPPRCLQDAGRGRARGAQRRHDRDTAQAAALVADLSPAAPASCRPPHAGAQQPSAHLRGGLRSHERPRELPDRELLRPERGGMRERMHAVREARKSREARGCRVAAVMRKESIHPRPRREAAIALLEAASLPASDLTDAHMEHFFFSGPESAPTGLAGVEICGAEALLRSLAVVPGQRSTGLGSALLEHAEAHARSSGVRSIFLLTTT